MTITGVVCETRVWPAPVVPRLTKSELRVLQSIADGYTTNAQIGEHLFMAESTAKNHTHSIFNKLGVPNRTAAVLLAVRCGLIVNRYELRP